MATVRRLVTSAGRKIGQIGEGRPTPTAYDAQVGLEVFEGMLAQMMASGDFGRLKDVIVQADYTAKEFERIINTSDADVTITLPATIDDPCADEDERVPRDLCPVVVVNPALAPSSYIYDAIVGDWVALFGLTLDSEAPLSQRGFDNLACLLAVALADEIGAQVGQATATRAASFLASIRQRNGSERRLIDSSESFL